MTSVRPKKHLGQHFLQDETIALQIVEALEESTEKLIEIGSGTGVLTKYLITRQKFFALDIDQESVEYLRKKYPAESHKILLQDFLKADVGLEKFSIIGNFPYNISSQIFFKVWDNRHLVREVVCLVQKEVGDRIASSYGSKVYGILSVLIQAFYHVDSLLHVPPEVFSPPPKVQSVVIRLRRNKVSHLGCDEELFKHIVKAGFGKRRKTLRNALKSLILPETEVSAPIFNLRAEQLSVNDFITLTQKISM